MYVGRGVCHRVCGGQGTSFCSWSSHSTMWIPGWPAHPQWCTPTVMHTHSDAVPYLIKEETNIWTSSSQSVGHNPFGEPLSPKLFTLWFITVAKLQLWSSSEDNFMVGATIAWGTNCIKGLKPDEGCLPKLSVFGCWECHVVKSVTDTGLKAEGNFKNFHH